jgi:hypothetical protein
MGDVTQPDLLERGRPDGWATRLPPALRRGGSALVVPLAAVVVLASLWSSRPDQPPPAPAPVDDQQVEPFFRQVHRLEEERRQDLIRTVPARYRDAAALASAMRGGRTPGNFFLAVAYDRSSYGALLVVPSALKLTEMGPVQWKRPDFERNADPEHRDISKPLDSFLALDTALHRGHRPDFSAGAYRPARLLGFTDIEARAVAHFYDVLDGAGVREGLPR